MRKKNTNQTNFCALSANCLPKKYAVFSVENLAEWRKSAIFAAQSRLKKYTLCPKSRLKKYTISAKTPLKKYIKLYN